VIISDLAVIVRFDVIDNCYYLKILTLTTIITYLKILNSLHIYIYLLTIDLEFIIWMFILF